MMATLERSLLHVEGADDFHAICHLLIRSGIDYDRRPWPAGYPEIKEVGGKDQLLDGMETAVSLSSGRSIGFVLDADSSLSGRWAAVSSRLARSGVETPAELPPSGFVGEASQYRARVGTWIMPDNQRDGTLEQFLADLVREEDSLFFHAKTATKRAQELNATFPDVLVAKAELHTWLAWQEEPGLPYGSAVRARYFGHDSEAAQSFVTWFCLLFGIDRRAAVPDRGSHTEVIFGKMNICSPGRPCLPCPVPATGNRVISVGVTSRGDEPMKIPILIEVTEDHRFRATGGEPFAAAVEADTPEAALDKMRRGVLERMAQGGRIAALDLPGGSNPWLQVFGMFQDDPVFDQWQQAINDNRRIVNDSEEGA